MNITLPRRMAAFTFIAGAMLVSACAEGARPELMSAAPAAQAETPLSGKVATGSVAGGDETSPLWTSEISAADFSAALTQSLASYGLLSAEGPYKLNAVLEEVDQPLIGVSLEVETTVNYQLTDAEGAVLWEHRNVAAHTATMGDAFIAAKRLRLANEGSAKANIGSALDKLTEDAAAGAISGVEAPAAGS